MAGRLLSAREWSVWIASFVVVAALLVATRFTSADPDSALYADLSARLAQEPVSHWIAPQWWGFWPDAKMTGYFREHPAGIFLVPAALDRLGIPGKQAAYITGVAAGLGALLLAGVLISRITSTGEGRAALVLLQLMPLAFIFRIRANHEYPMLLCLLAVLVGLDGVRRSWRWTWLVAAGLTVGLLVKGVFVVMILLAAALWIPLNPTGSRGSIVRPLTACLIGLGVMALTMVGYDAGYARVTGGPFWGAYWNRQLGPVTIVTPLEGASTLAGHAAFYLSRLLWHPFPWSVALLVLVWQQRRRLPGVWRSLPACARHGLLFALGFAVLAVVLLSPSSRFAERYAFDAAYMIGAAGAVTAWRTWAALRRALAWTESHVPALPAVVWLTLMLLRLALGPVLPRVGG
jgi:4-amino-4-deoxy-L-arabinose transferase-like glycosyltransferase